LGLEDRLLTLSNDPRAFGLSTPHHTSPRVSRLNLNHGAPISSELWLGGAHTDIGELLLPRQLEGAWLIDCAGELQPSYREAAAAVYMRVFADTETVPSSFERIAGLARDLALYLAGGELGSANGPDPLPAAPPERLYIMCSQGFNRSALFAGLLLRNLGVEAREAIRTIQEARPGSLSNQTYIRLLQAD
jgi:hypothetical protein